MALLDLRPDTITGTLSQYGAAHSKNARQEPEVIARVPSEAVVTGSGRP